MKKPTKWQRKTLMAIYVQARRDLMRSTTTQEATEISRRTNNAERRTLHRRRRT
jgi:hypothetical protein